MCQHCHSEASGVRLSVQFSLCVTHAKTLMISIDEILLLLKFKVLLLIILDYSLYIRFNLFC